MKQKLNFFANNVYVLDNVKRHGMKEVGRRRRKVGKMNYIILPYSLPTVEGENERNKKTVIRNLLGEKGKCCIMGEWLEE